MALSRFQHCDLSGNYGWSTLLCSDEDMESMFWKSRSQSLIPSPSGKHCRQDTWVPVLLPTWLLSAWTMEPVLIYLCPFSEYLPGRDRLVSVFYTAITSMLNPTICSLRNTDIKEILRMLSRRPHNSPSPHPDFHAVQCSKGRIENGKRKVKNF